jgi:putative glycerol-1-phosphate prenyltransferase
MDFRGWRHVFKLDPAKEISDQDLERLCESGTDAIIVGGTQDISFDNTIELMARVRRFPLPCVLEISNIEAVVPGFDFYFLPLVLNAGNKEWIFQRHIEGLMEYGSLAKWNEVAVEGYLILNPQSEAAKVTEALSDLQLEEIKAYGRLADQMLKLPVFYMEYSGTYGNPEFVKGVRSVLKQAHFFYGGGVQSEEQAREMAKWADTIVVGNIIYDNLEMAISTVNGVK